MVNASKVLIIVGSMADFRSRWEKMLVVFGCQALISQGRAVAVEGKCSVGQVAVPMCLVLCAARLLALFVGPTVTFGRKTVISHGTVGGLEVKLVVFVGPMML